jgi:hypothetical protein
VSPQTKARCFNYIVLAVDGDRRQFFARMSDPPLFEEIKGVVEGHIGDRMPHLRVQVGGEPADMFIDENAHFKCLDVNEAATNLLADSYPAKGDCSRTVRGPAVVFLDVIIDHNGNFP